MGRFFRKSSNDTQENSKDTQGREEALKAQEENTKLKEEINDLARERDKLVSQNTELTETNQKLTKEKTELTEKNKALTTEKENLNNQLNASQKQVQALEQSQQALKNEKAELSKDKENLTKEKTELTKKNKDLTTEKDNLNTDLSNAKSQVIQVNQEKENLEQKHAPYQKLEKLYEVFLEVKGCLNFNFVATTHSTMDLIAHVLSDSKYYLESLYNKASQELSDKKSDKGEKLAELFDLLFEYVKDKKFERLKEPSAYDSTCKSLYPEQNISQKMQRVVLIGYTYNKKTPPYYTIVDMGS
ncbi:hypothetical protein [Helicobacter pylori]|uniref:hypothetical protein n=1 Tax=Helicobacter pylori TaxID=210 RepID=UPI003D691946